jgi:dephospho-CoA kinase
MSRPFVIAITGGIASGKTTVCNYFSELGIEVIDADLIAREVVAKDQPALTEIVEHFGNHLLTETKELNRSALREIIFNDEQQRQWLNNLLHPLIADIIKQRIRLVSSEYALLAIPLLVESNNDYPYDRVLVIDIETEKQIERLMHRDSIDHHQASAVLNAQATREQRLAIADDQLTNDADLCALNARVLDLHHHYLELAKAHKAIAYGRK